MTRKIKLLPRFPWSTAHIHVAFRRLLMVLHFFSRSPRKRKAVFARMHGFHVNAQQVPSLEDLDPKKGGLLTPTCTRNQCFEVREAAHADGPHQRHSGVPRVQGAPCRSSAQPMATSVWLSFFDFPLLILKGIHRYWKYLDFFQGTSKWRATRVSFWTKKTSCCAAHTGP